MSKPVHLVIEGTFVSIYLMGVLFGCTSSKIDDDVFLFVVVVKVANTVIAQLLYLEADDQEKDIKLYINSPGGSITAGMGIYDAMQYVKPDVSTLCIGMAASMGAFLLSCGAKGKRYCLPNSEVMVHQP